MGRCDSIRVSTDLLMVNPNKGFKWHQDNQNGPIIPEEGLRFWITMDSTPADYGSPVYLKGSHENDCVSEEAVFVDIEMEGLEEWKDQQLKFRTNPGDMLIWHPKTVHKVRAYRVSLQTPDIASNRTSHFPAHFRRSTALPMAYGTRTAASSEAPPPSPAAYTTTRPAAGAS